MYSVRVSIDSLMYSYKCLCRCSRYVYESGIFSKKITYACLSVCLKIEFKDCVLNLILYFVS